MNKLLTQLFSIALITMLSALSVKAFGQSPLSGTYTVGSDLSDNFSTITDAVDSLESDGVNGAVVIQIDSGLFVEQIEIGAIPGASSSNTITFKGAGVTKTTVRYSPTTSNRTIFSLSNASHLIFDSLKVQAVGTYGICFNLRNNTDTITIKNCLMVLSNSGSTAKGHGVANYAANDGTGSSTVDNITIQDNEIIRGYESVRIIGNSSASNTLLITRNRFTSFGYAGVNASGTVDAEISYNYAQTAVSSARFAINMWPTGHSISIIGNNVHVSSNVNHTRVIQVASAPGAGGSSWSQEILVANNMVIYDGSYANNMTGIYTKHVNYIKFYNNTVHMEKGSGAKCLWLDALSNTGAIDVKNNNLSSVTNGQVFRVHNLVSTTTNYNNFYNTSGLVINWKGTNYSTLSSYNNATSQGANSVSIDPKFLGPTDLHIDTTNVTFNGRGTPVSAVTVDIDGDTRNATNPDIGADEFTTGADIELLSIESPYDCHRANISVFLRVWIKNVGTSPISNIPLTFKIGGGATVTSNYLGTIAPGDSALHGFSQTANMSTPGTYQLTAYHTFAGDEDKSNDTVSMSVSLTALWANKIDSVGGCSGDNIIVDPEAPTATSYLWSDNSTGSTNSFNVTNAGMGRSVHWVEMEDAFGCKVRDSFTVVISVPPAFNLGNDTSLCEGDTMLLDVSGSGTNYTWQNGSSADTFKVNAGGQYRVEVTGGYQCSVADSIMVVYNNNPIVNLGDSITICDGDEYKFSPGVEFATYLWQDQSVDSVFIASVQGTYSVSVVDINGCSAGDSALLIVNASPFVDLGPDTVRCGETILRIDATTAGSTYKWQNGYTGNSYPVSSEGTYWVTVTNGLNCSYTDTIVVTDHDIPVVNLGADTTLCEGDQMLLDATIDGASYLWQDHSTESTFNVSAAGEYKVEVKSQDGCTNSDTIEIMMNPTPQFDLGRDTIIGFKKIQETPLTLEVPAGYDAYIWSNGKTSNSIVIDESISLGEHTYFVAVTNEFGCQGYDTIIVEIYNDASVSSYPNAEINVYPNPAQSSITLKAEGVNENLRMEILDLRGRLVIQQDLTVHHNTIKEQVDISKLAKGNYIVRLLGEQGVWNSKLNKY